jgi:hypothetical protein
VASVQQCQPIIKFHEANTVISINKDGDLSGHVLPNSAELTSVNDCELKQSQTNMTHHTSPKSSSPCEGQGCSQAIDVAQFSDVEQLAQQSSLLAQNNSHSKQPDPSVEAVTLARAEHDALEQKVARVRTMSTVAFAGLVFSIVAPRLPLLLIVMLPWNSLKQANVQMETQLHVCEAQLQDEQKRRAMADDLKAEAFAAFKSSQDINSEQLQNAQVHFLLCCTRLARCRRTSFAS